MEGRRQSYLTLDERGAGAGPGFNFVVNDGSGSQQGYSFPDKPDDEERPGKTTVVAGDQRSCTYATGL